MDPFANIIRKQWKGEEPLWKAFWVYGMMVSTLLESVLILGLDNVGSDAEENLEGIELFFLLMDAYAVLLSVVFIFAYGTWNFVSVWRCARNTEKALWRWSARSFYVLGIGLLFGYIFFAIYAGFQTATDLSS